MPFTCMKTGKALRICRTHGKCSVRFGNYYQNFNTLKIEFSELLLFKYVCVYIIVCVYILYILIIEISGIGSGLGLEGSYKLLI